MHKKERMGQKLSRFWRILGPGLVTGAADDDPSGIATYSQTGAQFGTKQLWTAVMMLPFMIAVQEAAARISVVTRSGLAEVIRNNYSRKVLYFAVLLMVFANIFNIGADIGAMVETVNLLVPLPFFIGIVFITAVIVFLELFVPYRQYAKILKLSTFALFAYPLTLVMIHVPWGYILRQTITPHFELNFNFLFIIVGVLGTTISPYLFFWQGNQEVEEEKEAGMVDNPHFTAKIKKMLAAMRLDNAVGMIMSEFVTWSIIVVTALVLNKNGVQNINTAAQAAAALEPLVHNFLYAGFFAKLLFAIGIIGSGLLAIPVLAGSASYALSEAAKWEEGLSLKFWEGRHFYGAIIAVMLLGMLMNFLGLNPIKALILAAVLNGIAAPPLIYLIIKIGNNKKIMHHHTNGKMSNLFLWITFIAMSAATLTAIVSLF